MAQFRSNYKIRDVGMIFFQLFQPPRQGKDSNSRLKVNAYSGAGLDSKGKRRCSIISTV